jgi:hypothetical protein
MSDQSGTEVNLVLGEVHTALLQSSTALPAAACERLVGLVGGERVSRFERPIAHVASPSVLTGIDCRLAARSGVKTRGIGTVESRASMTGGHVVQGAARVQVVRGWANRRLPWSYYLARRGRVEAVGRASWDDLAFGFVDLADQAACREPTGAHPDQAAVLDLGGASARMVDALQRSPMIDRRAPFRAGRTRLRWAAVGIDADQPATVRFSDDSGELRTLVVHWPGDVNQVAGFSEDLALHDWLLTTLLRLIDRSRLGIDDRGVAVARLRPAVEHLLHLWMPAARLDEAVAACWVGLERRPGLGRQWQAAVNRIRDQLALSATALLGERLGEVVR